MVDVPVTGSGVALLVVGSLLCVFAVVAVCLRIRSIHIVQRRLFLHDYFAFLALILGVGYLILSYLCVFTAGLGHHAQELSTDTLANLLKLLVTAETTWMLAITFTKLSILLFYLDLFGFQHILRRFTYGFVVSVVISFAVFVLEEFAICPPAGLDSDLLTPRHCGLTINVWTISAIIDMILDIAIVILPIPVAFELTSSRGNKLKILGIFAVGGIICLISISRLILLQFLDQADISYSSIPSFISASVEMYLGIIAVCLPTFDPIFTRRQAQPLLSPGLPPPKSPWTFNRKRSVDSSYANHPAFDSDEELYLRDRASTKHDRENMAIPLND